MGVKISLYSNKKNEINRFLNSFYGKEIELKNNLEWEYTFENPIQSAEILGVFIDNNDKYKINMWISLDEGFYINVTEHNANKLIRYLFERYPY